MIEDVYSAKKIFVAYKLTLYFQRVGTENGRLSVCTVDRKASIVSSLYQDVSPTKLKDHNISPAPSQLSFVDEGFMGPKVKINWVLGLRT